MWWMAGTEDEIQVSMGGFSVGFCGQYHLLPDGQNVQERNHTVLPYFHSELDGRP
jgi:hypothetical protein